MKSTTFLALAGAAAAADYADFEIPYLKAHMPNGQKFDYYDLEFNVTSSHGDSPSSAWCRQWWGDNGMDGKAWSTAVPVGEWHQCTVAEGSEELSDISFQLFPYYSIGNFSLALRQNFTETIDSNPTQIIAITALDPPSHISNTTSDFAYNCTINPFQNPYEIHAGGDCETTPGSSGFRIPVSSASPACSHATTVTLSFPVQLSTQWGESVYVVGSIPALGEWDLSRAVPLSAEQYDSGEGKWSNYRSVWVGGDVEVEAGTTFEWKPVKKNSDGSWTWMCGENLKASVDEFTCGEQDVAETPVWFACGN